MHLLNAMFEVLPIGPEEWEEVQSRHSARYQGRSVESLRRKYQELHRKDVPTGDPHCPADVKLAKRVKYAIGDKAELGGGEEDYTLEENSFAVPGGVPVGSAGNDRLIGGLMQATRTDAQAQAAAIVDNHDPMDVSTSSLSSSRPSPTRPRREKGGDFLAMMQMQMLQEASERKTRAAEREEERKDRAQEARLERQERALDREQMQRLIATAVGGFIGHSNKKRKKSSSRKRAERLGIDGSDDESDTSTSS